MSLDKDYATIFQGLQEYVRPEEESDFENLRKFARAFVIKKHHQDEFLWELSSSNAQLHFILSGAFGEYLVQGKHPQLIRFYRKEKFAFSEDMILYSARPATYSKCLVEGRVASIPVNVLMSYVQNSRVGSKLLTGLIALSMTEYRNTTYEMLQTSGTDRINAALEQFPDLLNIIPRKELADYLGISRASLFRSLKQIDVE